MFCVSGSFEQEKLIQWVIPVSDFVELRIN